MKNNKRIYTFSAALMLLWSPLVMSERIVFDDFSQGYLDSDRWREGEGMRHIDNGKLVLSARHAAFEASDHYWRLPANAGNGNPVGIRANVAVTDASVNAGARGVVAGIHAKFTVGADRFSASVLLGDRGNGLEAIWWLEKATVAVDGNVTVTIDSSDSGTVIEPGTLQLNQEYALQLAWNSSGELVASSHGTEVVLDTMTGTQLDSTFFQLQAGVNIQSGYEPASITATFDDVETLGDVSSASYSLLDDFESEEIDQGIWSFDRGKRMVSNGRLELETQGQGSRKNTPVNLNYTDGNYLEATVRLNSATNVIPGNGARARMQLLGNFYNQSVDAANGGEYDGATGDVVGFMGIEERTDSSGTGTFKRFFAGASLSKDAQRNDTETIYFQPFDSSVEYDTDYTLSMELVDDKLVYKAGDAMLEFSPSQDNGLGIYPVQTPFRTVLARVERGAGGFVSGSVDQVYSDVQPNVAPVISEGETVSLGAVVATGSIKQVLNATDANGDAITWSISTPPSAGTVTLSTETGATTELTYTAPDDPQAISFIVTATDATGRQDTITLTGDVEATVTPSSSGGGSGSFGVLGLVLVWAAGSLLTRRKRPIQA